MTAKFIQHVLATITHDPKSQRGPSRSNQGDRVNYQMSALRGHQIYVLRNEEWIVHVIR